jgi:very-short-patch-repair endonuclease
MTSKNAFKNGGMFEGANHLIFEKAKQLRGNMTHAEEILWIHLKKGINGFKFRRQHPIGLYIADFYCHKAKLIIEIDGSIHDKTEVKDNDVARENEIQRWGYEIIRFTNQEVLEQTEKVIDAIAQKILNPQTP